MTLDEIIQESHSLSDQDKVKLIEFLDVCLLASDYDADVEFLAELDRRVEEIDSGTAQGIPMEEVFQRLEQKLNRN